VGEADPIVKEVFLEGTPDEIFPDLTESDRLIQWKGVSAQLDPRPGGLSRFDPTGSGRDVVSGRYLEVDPPHRVVFTWGFEREGHPVPAGSTTVEIELIPHQAGTLLRLTHRGLSADQRTNHLDGWAHYLPRLKARAAGADPGHDAFADVRLVGG
jgi:uncharacterized protein YndB with AHSA1/START domain